MRLAPLLPAVMASLFFAAAAAQDAPPAVPPPPDDPGQVSELVVVAHPQGPAMWKVQVGDSTMTILGSVSPIHQQQAWDKRPLLAAMDGARLVLLPPRADLGPLQMMALLTGNLWKVRTVGDLEPRLPPALRARFVQARMVAQQPQGRYAHWKPAAAGFLLLADSRHVHGLSMGKPGSAVAKLAEARHIATKPIGSVSVLGLAKLAGQLDERENLACLDDVLAQAELEHAASVKVSAEHINDDWARGDVVAVNARYRLPPLQRCLMLAPGARQLIDREMAEAADRLWAELQKPGKTVAVIDMAWLLPRDGLLDRLKAKGAAVGSPPALREAAE